MRTRSVNTLQPDTSNTPSSTDANNNSTSSNKQPTTSTEIKNTPFRLVHIPEHGYFISLGIHRIGNLHKTKDEALIELNTRIPWQMICNVIVTLIEQTNDILNAQKNNKQ